MVCESRRIKPDSVAAQRFEKEWISNAAHGNHIDGTTENLGQILAQPHERVEEICPAVWEVDQHIDIAARRVEIVSCSGPDQFQKRNATPSACGADAVEIFKDEVGHSVIECIPLRNARRAPSRQVHSSTRLGYCRYVHSKHRSWVVNR